MLFRSRLWLIAKKLVFSHPVTGERISVETELESEWLTVFAGLGWSEQDLQGSVDFLEAADLSC